MNQAPSPHPLSQDPRWQALIERDVSQDGAFVYAVKTTGIFCRPSCPARRPKPENVEFLASPILAERAGYRPCKRCRPTSAHPAAQKVVAMCRYLEETSDAPSLESLGHHVGFSPSHAQRVFTAALGMSPKEYRAWHRGKKARELLAAGNSVTETIYEAGYNSSGRFYEKANATLGMTPTRFKNGGEGMTIRFAVGQCSLGAVLVAATDRGVCAIALADDPEELVKGLQDRFHQASLVGGDAQFETLVAQVVGLIEHPTRLPEDFPLDVQGTAFQCRVWKALLRIPAGETATYAQIAESLGAPKSYRAVAQACGANTVAVAIPCHRVVRTDGSLSGYRWGVERKRALLDREQAAESV